MSSKSTNQNASTHPQDVVDRVNSKNSQPISSPYRESLIINYPASSIGNFAFGEDPIEHLATRFQTLHEESIKQKSRLNNERPTFRLSDVAEKTGLSAQYINNLVVRYKLLNPTKTKEHGTRESYEFSEEDIELINRLKHLTIQGRPFREALEFLKEDVRYQNDAKRLMSAFQLWSHDPTPESWRILVTKIGDFAIFEEREKHTLLCIDGGRMTLAQCAVELQLPSEDAVIALLDSAYAKIGRVLMYVLRLVMPGAI